MKEMTTSSKQKKFLKGLGHKISPVVYIGKEGISESIINTVNIELENHELIKVKIGNNADTDKKEASNIIPQATKSSLVQLIGKTLLLFKRSKNKPKDKRIILPRS